jgi:hypothetical protein
MAIDFPASPTVGQKHPTTPIEGIPQYTYDGEKWITGISNTSGVFVAKAGDTMTGALVLPADPTAALEAATKQYVDSGVGAARPQRFALGGLNLLDITIPAAAVGAHISGLFWYPTSTAVQTGMRCSVTPGVFLSGAADYVLNGFFTPSSGGGANAAAQNVSYMALHSNHEGPVIPATTDMTLWVVRPNSSAGFASMVRGSSNTAAAGITQILYQERVAVAAVGSILRLAELRIFNTTSAIWLADSYLDVEWF